MEKKKKRKTDLINIRNKREKREERRKKREGKRQKGKGKREKAKGKREKTHLLAYFSKINKQILYRPY